MGLLVEGKWQDKWYDTDKNDGKFKRQNSVFRNWVKDEPDAEFKPESGRYHLYVSLACPWAHRTLIFRELKGLQEHIGVSVVSPEMLDKGWTFDTESGSTGDHLYGNDFMYQLYTRVDDNITTRVTVPVLWDKQTETIVSNESADIIRMFNSAFNSLTGNELDFYPEALHDQINDVNALVYDNINNGVYKCGFATTQQAYEEEFAKLVNALDVVEEMLGKHRYLCGDTLTEADWRLFTTLIRFDPVYYGHFKCNHKRIIDYPNLYDYMRELYQYPGVSDTTDFYHIKRHYYFSHTMINPTQVVPVGPEQDLSEPHTRDRSYE